MKVTEGFDVANSCNIPKVDFFMLLELMKTSEKYNASEIRGAKAFLSTRAAYVDNAVGYVEIKREEGKCIVKARVTPEHKVKSTAYRVTVIVDEDEEKVDDALCHSCAASEGGCKHSLCLLMWLNRRTEEPAVTEVTPYWKKPRLAEAVTQDKFVLAKNIGKPTSTSTPATLDSIQVPTPESFLLECRKQNISNCLFANFCDGEVTDTCRAQIMTQMFAAKKTKGLLCMADPKFEHNNKIYKFWIEYDPQYMSILLRGATDFWENFIFNKLIDSVKS